MKKKTERDRETDILNENAKKKKKKKKEFGLTFLRKKTVFKTRAIVLF